MARKKGAQKPPTRQLLQQQLLQQQLAAQQAQFRPPPIHLWKSAVVEDPEKLPILQEGEEMTVGQVRP
jgi:hypothetical protein